MSNVDKGCAAGRPGRDEFHPVFSADFSTPSRHQPAARSRVLVIDCAPAGAGPGRTARACRPALWTEAVLEAEGIEVDLMDLGHGRRSGRDDVRARWLAAHGIVIVTPGGVRLGGALLGRMLERLACPGTAAGAACAHLGERVYGVVVHGDAAGADGTRRALSGWLDSMGLVDAGTFARLDRHAGYYDADADGAAACEADSGADRAAASDADLREQAGNVARALKNALVELRADRLSRPNRALGAAWPG